MLYLLVKLRVVFLARGKRGGRDYTITVSSNSIMGYYYP